MISNSDWLLFSGSIIGGLMTMLGVIFTLRHNEKQRKLSEMPMLKIDQIPSSVETTKKLSYFPPNTSKKENKIVEYNFDTEYIKASFKLNFKNVGKKAIKFYGIDGTSYDSDVELERFNALGVDEDRNINVEVLIDKKYKNEYDDFHDILYVHFEDYQGMKYVSKVSLVYRDTIGYFRIMYLGHSEARMTSTKNYNKMIKKDHKESIQ